VLVNVLTALHEALTSLLRGPPDKRALLDNFDTLLLAIDEMIDSGMILETEATAVVNRVGMKCAKADGRWPPPLVTPIAPPLTSLSSLTSAGRPRRRPRARRAPRAT